MAKIKLFSYSELIDVSEKEAREIEQIWNDPMAKKDSRVTIGAISVLKGDIRGIFFDVDLNPDDTYKNNLIDYYQGRNLFLELPPEEKAKQNSWGHFSLFYRAMFGQRPEIEKEVVRSWAAEFYKQNPEWSNPSCMLWFSLLGRNKMDDRAMRILERVEGRELQDIKENKEYREKMKSKNAPEKEIVVENLAF